MLGHCWRLVIDRKNFAPYPTPGQFGRISRLPPIFWLHENVCALLALEGAVNLTKGRALPHGNRRPARGGVAQALARELARIHPAVVASEVVVARR